MTDLTRNAISRKCNPLFVVGLLALCLAARGMMRAAAQLGDIASSSVMPSHAARANSWASNPFRKSFRASVQNGTDCDGALVVPELADRHADPGSTPIRVALLAGVGTSERSVRNIKAVLECWPELFAIELVRDARKDVILTGRFDVLLIPGGVAQVIASWHRRRSDNLRATSRRFVSHGGGYLGICAGAYLGTTPAFNLSSVHTERAMAGFGWVHPAQVNVSAELWSELPTNARQLPKGIPTGGFAGRDLNLADNSARQWTSNGTNSEQLANQSHSLLASVDDPLFYANGPIFSPISRQRLERGNAARGLHPLVTAGPSARMKITSGPEYKRSIGGRILAVTNRFGAGRVVLTSVHPETDPTSSKKPPSKCSSGQAKLLRELVAVAAQRNLRSDWLATRT